MKEFTKQRLVSAVSMLMTGLVCTNVSNASDISIYRAAEKGNITLMFLLDNSGSMSNSGSYDNTGVTRLERVRNGMIDVLAGGNGAAALSNDKIIGLSSFYNSSSGYVLVPARALNAEISGGGKYTLKKPIYKLYTDSVTSKAIYSKCTTWSSYSTCTAWTSSASSVTGSSKNEACAKDNYSSCTLYYSPVELSVTDQRSLLLKEMSTWTGSFSTPTAPAYAEVGAYMLGTRTASWYSCGLNGNSDKGKCTTAYADEPVAGSYSSETNSNELYYYSGNGSNKKYYYKLGNPSGGGFGYSTNDAKTTDLKNYNSPVSNANSQCSGQGIYVLTDGEPNSTSASSVAKTLMENALTTTYSSKLTCSGSLFNKSTSTTGWDCISDFSQLLLNRKINGDASTSQMSPKNLTIKTAVVGFGGDFNGITSYNSALTQKQNLDNINNSTADADVKNAAKWGVFGQGGWYSGSSSADVVSSVNSFISSLATDIPSVTTGESYIPSDQLNPSAVQNYTYSSQFQPTPDATYQLWAGNLKKYQVVSGYIKDVKGNSITNSSGKIEDNYDYWSETILSSATNSAVMKLIGGAKANLPVGMATANVANRKLLINRDVSGTATATTLNQIGTSYVTNTTDSSRGYLLSLLGYIIADPANPPSTITALSATSSLRQLGAVMHSSPILLTQSGVIGSSSGEVTTSDRDDYALFGTTQGVLSVVNANTGVEKFAFVPNEMVSTQKKAFLENTTSSGFSTSTYQPFYYGIDAPWTSYSEYVLKSDKTGMTVGTGVGTSTGVQMAYGGLRMGGRSYYALNLQNMDTPSLAFRIDPTTGKVYYNSTFTAYKELAFMGQSWSKPTIGFVKWNGKKTRVMFVGGGYDAGGTDGDGIFDTVTGERTGFSGYESSDYVQGTDNKRGAGVYMFNAETGALLWWGGANATSANTTDGVGFSTAADMRFSVVSQIRSVDRNADALIDHLYFGDLGGQMWRVDLNNNMATFDKNSFAKTPQRLLNLNNGLYSPRFYEMPAFSTYRNSGSTFGVVSIGSGNRSLPRFNSSSTSYKNDAIYNIYDKDVARSDVFTMNGSVYQVCETKNTSTNAADKSCRGDALATKNIELANLGQVTSNDNKTAVAPYDSKDGWYYYFASSLTQDAKVLSTPIVLDSDMYVTTFDGSKAGLSGDCGAGVKGESFVYQFCMPYGVCTQTQIGASTFLKGVSLGAGIISPAVGSSNASGSNRVLVSGNGVFAGGKSKTYSTPLSLVPVRWYETSK